MYGNAAANRTVSHAAADVPPVLSVIVSVMNEEANIAEFYRQTAETLTDESFELIFVDDGSTDGSAAEILALRGADARVKMLKLSRNFGHEAAMLAGIDHACGDALACMDADLQHPPSCLAGMLQAYRKGFDVVNMTRTSYHEKTPFLKRALSAAFYKVLNVITAVKLEENASDFFLISRRAADVLRAGYREQTRFLRGFIQIIGFRKTVLSFEARERHGGASKYSLRKLLNLSVNALTSFSNVPLRIGVFAGCLTGLASIAIALYSLYMHLFHDTPPGYTTTVILLCVLFSINFFVVGIIGEYIGHILYEVKGRPIYIVDEFIA